MTPTPDKPAGEALKACPTCGASAMVDGWNIYCSNPWCPDPPADEGDASWEAGARAGAKAMSAVAVSLSRAPPPSALDNEVERLGEALYALSAHLQVLGLLKNDAFHEDYEKVVAAFQPLLTRLK